MNTIGFWGQVDLEQVKKIDLKNVTLFKPRNKELYLGLEYVKEQLKDFKVIVDWEYAYEGGEVEFLIDYEPEVDIEPVKKNIEQFKGLVSFIRFY